jgi:hypothetical protein
MILILAEFSHSNCSIKNLILKIIHLNFSCENKNNKFFFKNDIWWYLSYSKLNNKKKLKEIIKLFRCSEVIFMISNNKWTILYFKHPKFF